MRPSSALTAALTATAAVALTATGVTAAPAGTSAPRPGICQEQSLSVSASSGGQRNVARIAVTNRGGSTCVVDRIPTVTFRGLDGSAEAVPPATSGPYVLSPGEHGYAAVRTAAPGATEGHVVRTLSVAADPSHHGVTFGAATVGMGRGIQVWEPVTTLWHTSRAAADRALADATR
ncbi:DUF4232 domain-containing protein [Streptomyces sp. DT20]|uniref:DUF4232 domain-containing protein n=1 Tax=unclassified Streptomyces TaxID=2593676 RepID=UPI00093BDA1A|nr:DUF4232 domain-containing protein [Streptomyces sp. CB02488]OKK23611.1 hypothetical protein AMK09_10395 [Streptomyces sp. CB02488]WRZ15539.1 DUF4232 domain-containing protein [Streptomyces sp. NBC_00341]